MLATSTAARPLGKTALSGYGPEVSVPTYDRDALTPAIVHIGVGGFHRSHQAAYLDRLAETGASRDWGIVGVGLRSPSMSDALASQDGLYTLLERGADGDRARVVGSIGRCLFGPADPAAVLEALADPRTRLVTLTITGDGYNVDPATGRFDESDPSVKADLEAPETPSSFFGYIVEALDRRRRAGLAPFTVLSCDNMPSNGTTARTAVVSFAQLRDEVLARWIEHNVSFPSSMVDRITPETSDSDRALLAGEFGIHDAWPVVSEPFSQWIVEDNFCNGRPPLEAVGVQFVDDVEPYKLVKSRLLNGTHSAMGYLGYLAGHRQTGDAMQDPLIRDYVARLMDHEVRPLLPEVAGIDIVDYQQTLVERFGNPKVGDRLERLCGRGSTKVPSYLLPSIVEARDLGRPHGLLTVAVAAWLRYLRGVDFAGNPIEIKDALADRLCPLAVANGNDPRPILSNHDIFGDLGRDSGFAASVEQALVSLDRDGAKGLLRTSFTDHAVAARAA